MKKIALYVVTIVTMSSLGFAGGDIGPVVVQESVETDNFYIGVGIQAMSTRDSSVSMDIFNVKRGQDRLGNISLNAGYEFNNYLAVEGRYATSFTDEDKVKLDSSWSILLKPMYKFEDEEERATGEDYFAVYALLGYGNVNIKGQNFSIVNVDESDFQWGLGFSYTFRENSDSEEYQYKDSWTIFADYVNSGNNMDGPYYNGAPKVDSDAFTVGISYKF